MNRPLRELCLSLAVCSLPSLAGARPLTVVNVAANDVNCAFEPDCTFNITNGVTNFAIPGTTGTTAQLQIRAFSTQSTTPSPLPPNPTAPTTIKHGYEYRIDLTQTTTTVDASCVTGLDVDFGPIIKLQYDRAGSLDDVFVISKGAEGIGLSSAAQNGNVITFTFVQPVCAGDGSSPGQATFFFGLASANALKPSTARVEAPAADPINVRTGAPDH